MSSQPETRAERASRMLGEAAEIMLSAMRGLGERLNDAETAEAAQGLAMALARVNRGLRQTLLLDARLETDARAAEEAAARAAEADAAKAVEAEIRAKKFKVRYAAGREIVEACESEDEAKERLDALDDNLDAYVRGFDFAAGTMEELVEALLADLGIERDGDDDEDAAVGPAAAPEAPDAGLGPPPEFDWAPGPDSS